jgi:hypothetical protein
VSNDRLWNGWAASVEVTSSPSIRVPSWAHIDAKRVGYTGGGDSGGRGFERYARTRLCAELIERRQWSCGLGFGASAAWREHSGEL